MMRIIIFLVTNIAVMLLFGTMMFFMRVQFFNLVNLLIVSGIIGFGGSIISLLMSKYIALFSTHGKVLNEKTTDLLEIWLLHVVHDQSKKLGLMMPQVVIYESLAMNAFTTGPRKNSALVAVSTGLLRNMDRNEIEAVIAHEMTHIYNGDMVTLTLIQGVINTFVIFISRMLAKFISYCMASCENDVSDQNSSAGGIVKEDSSVYFFISIVLESIFGILASVITLWFSRHREFYADAGAAKLVGSANMISALQKLKLSYEPKESNIIISFCINGRIDKNVLSELFMSHPRLDHRIKALRNGWYLNENSSFFHF